MSVREDLQKKYGQKEEPAMTVRQKLEAKYGKPVVAPTPIVKRAPQASLPTKKQAEPFNLKEFGKGIVKGAGNTVADMVGLLPGAVKFAETVTNPVKSVINTVQGVKSPLENVARKISTSKPVEEAKKHLTYNNKSQKLGGYAETAGEILLTGGTKAVRSVAGKVAKETTEKFGKAVAGKVAEASKKQAKNLNNIFDNSTNAIRKQTKRVADKDINIGEEITKRKIEPKVSNDRLTFDVKHIKDLETEIATKGSVIDEAASVYDKAHNVQISGSDLKKRARQTIFNDPEIIKQGRAQELYAKAARKIDQYGIQNGGKPFTVEQINNMKKGMYDISRKYAGSDIKASDAYSELGHTFMRLVEDELPDIAVRNLNREIGTAVNIRNFLSQVDKQKGIVLEGGKMGKYFSQAAGVVSGAVAGSAVGGPVGAGFGAAVGSKLASMIKNSSQRASILGRIDRALIKRLSSSPKDSELLNVQKFIEDAKNGKILTPSNRTAKIINDFLFPKEKRLMLPSPKPGSPKVSNNIPINLGKPQSTIDLEEGKRLWYSRLKKPAYQLRLPAGTSKSNGPVIRLGSPANLDKQVLPKNKK